MVQAQATHSVRSGRSGARPYQRGQRGGIQIREVRDAVNGRLEEMDAANDDELADAARALLDELAAIEQDLYQVRNRSNQDPLNFPIKVNNRLASLRRSIEAGDARPTDAAYRVFEELSAELDGHLTRLQAALEATQAPHGHGVGSP